MKINQIGRQAAIYSLSVLLVRGVQLVLIPVYSRFLSTGDYGVIEAIAIAGAIVNLTVALEVTQGMARYVSDVTTAATRAPYASTALIFGTVAYGVFALLVTIFADDVSNALLNGYATPLTITVAVWSLALNGVFALAQDILRWHFKSIEHMAGSLVYACITAGFGSYLVSDLAYGSLGVFLGQFSGAICGILVSLVASYRILPSRFSFRCLRDMLSFSVPLVVSSLAVLCNLYIDRIVIAQNLGLDALGVYGVAARYASVVAILTIGLQAALGPVIYRNWRDPDASERLATIFHFYLVFMVLCIGAISLFSTEIFSLMAGPSYFEGRLLLPILAMSAMFSTLYIFAPGLYLAGKTKKAAALNLFGAALNMSMTLIFIPYFGLVSAALASLAANSFVFLSYIYWGQKDFRVRYDNKLMVWSLGLVALLVVMGRGLNQTLVETSLCAASMKALLLATSFALAWTYGLTPEHRTRIITRQ